ncbi:UDP-galactopyranose mutase [Streptomyces mirabilis]|uniref:UDP-galactopyranose mutase n=2 Tax=Streptomyces mirabilis TaxID=68239 RepID=UPI000BCE9770|nr:UDP-galactopyranose mutase [Streptomyces sp. OK228]
MGGTATIVGAGLAGAAAAWFLTRRGFSVEVYEQAHVVGGHVRTEWFRGIPYEPHGAHIFHTDHRSVWDLVSGTVEFVPYRHRVLTRLRGRLVSWPPQRAELCASADFTDIALELADRPGAVDESDFESYCVSVLGPTLYGESVRGYTEKQWGRHPRTLSAAVARGRVELRNDGCHDFFRDTYQGWPRRGYGDLVEALLRQAVVHLGCRITLKDLPEVSQAGRPVIVTSALDDFLGEAGALQWRGVRLQPVYLPETALAQPAMVVNEPSVTLAWTRSIETKWALPELHDRLGTLVLREYPGAEAKHYPVLDAAGENQRTQRELEHRLLGQSRNPIHTAGRLATYSYINMDVAILQGLRVAEKVAAQEEC